MTPPYIPTVSAPDIIEKDRNAKAGSTRDDIIDTLKPQGNWLGGDPFYEMFKTF